MKDIWAWLWDADGTAEADRPTDLYEQLRSASKRKDSEGVRAAADHLIAVGKATNQPWLGVFARHWHLQYRLNDLSEGQAAVPAAVEAFEIAHRDENLGCPQSVCSTQDLCIAYSTTDGPGYADEVIAASEATLERIDPSWPCYDCVSTELVRGLLNAGRPSDAIDAIDAVEVAIRREGVDPTLGFESDRIDALLKLGRADEALAVATTVDPDRFAQHSERAEWIHQLAIARCHARTGEPDQARALFAAVPNPLDEPGIGAAWLAAADDLLETKSIANDDELSSIKVHLAHRYRERGALRDGFDLAASATAAAAARGARHSASRSRALAQAISGDLVRPEQVSDILAELDRAIDEMPATVHADAPLDAEIEVLERERLVGSLDDEGFHRLIQRLMQQGWTDAPTAYLRDRFDADPSPATAGPLLELLLRNASANDSEALREIDELADQLESVSPAFSHWARARAAALQGRWDDVAIRCNDIVTIEPDAINTRRLWSVASRRLGDFHQAAALCTEILDMADTGEASDLWAAIESGTLAGDWPLVRRAAAGIGFQLESTAGPIDESWEWCHVTFLDDDGVQRTHEAQRTGPATARIMQVAHPEHEQRYGDTVVFEPIPLDPPPDDPEEARQTPVRYRAILTVERGNHRAYLIQGRLVDDDQWLTLRDALFTAGFPVWAYPSPATDLPDGTWAPTLTASVAHGPDRTPHDLALAVEQSSEGWPFPLTWPTLAAETGRDVDDHRRRLDALWGG